MNTGKSKTESVQKPAGNTHAHKLIFGYLAILIIAALLGCVYQWQHHQVINLNAKVSSLQYQLSKSNSQDAKNQKALKTANNQL